MRTLAERGGWSACRSSLREAALRPERRVGLLREALGGVASGLSAPTVALARRGTDTGWLVECVGENESRTGRWLSTSLGAGPHRLTDFSGNLRSVLDVGVEGRDGLLFVFGVEPALVSGMLPDEVLRGLRLLVEVELLETVHPGEGDILDRISREPSSLRAGEGLSEMLSLARDVGGADFTYWGTVRDGVLDVSWNYGASDSDFGFELPLGEGIGGRAFARGEAFEVTDYLNCQYRYPGVSEATDSEKVRTALAIPVRGGGPGAVLYAVRREVETFTEAQRTMLVRIRDAIHSVPGAWSTPPSLYISKDEHLRLQKSGLRKHLLDCERVCDLASWLEGVVRGPVMVLDGGGHPYLPTDLPRLENLDSDMRRRTFPIPGGRASGGSLAIWPSAEFPPASWPDLADDVLSAFGVVLDRVEQTRERLGRQRSQWVRSAASSPVTEDLRRDGNRLGLPTRSGEVWALAWDTDREQPRLRMLADDVFLDLLGEPLTVVEDGLGVVLSREKSPAEPSTVRDALLRHVGPTPLWLSHGATYEEAEGLRGALQRATHAVENLRTTDNGSFIVEVDGRDLDSLLGNPTLSAELVAFAEKMLAPLEAYDTERNTSLTETFCRTLALGSPDRSSEELYIHPNTVRYRMRRAEEVLETDLTRPKDRTAFSLAAFVWLGERR